MNMRKHKRQHYAFLLKWRRYWRYRIFAETFFPTIVIHPDEL